MTDVHRLHWQPMNPRTPAEATAPGARPNRPHVLRSTDFDPLKHMNNAAYWAAVEDELVDHPDLTAQPYRAVIEYLRPAPPGAEMLIRRHRNADRLQLWMIVDEHVVATVTVVTHAPQQA